MCIDDQEFARWIAHYLNEHSCGVTSIQPETDLLAAGALDSLAIADLLAALDSQFEVTLDPSDITPGNFRSPQVLASLIGAKFRAIAAA